MNRKNTNEICEKFSIEEYKELRAEIRQRESNMTQFLVVGLVANVTLISGVTAFYYNMYKNTPNEMFPILSYLFLAPAVIIVPLLLILNSHRRDIRLIGSYIQVFYEETGYGPLWEIAHDKRANYNADREGHDFIPVTFWGLLLICLALYGYNLYLCSSITIYYLPIPLLIIMIMAATHMSYNSSKHEFYRKNLEMWRSIRLEMVGKMPNEDYLIIEEKIPYPPS
jgi:hypothetical protein